MSPKASDFSNESNVKSKWTKPVITVLNPKEIAKIIALSACSQFGEDFCGRHFAR